ncbi:MAG: hypothetical protein GY838_13445, partial [bacterium]|nr:hypothetical protein [bacterium]
TFSEELDPATAAVGQAGDPISLVDGEDPEGILQAATLSLGDDGTVLDIVLDSAADAWWRDRPVRLQVGPPLADLSGNEFATGFEVVFFPGGQGDLSGGFLSGEAYDDTTSRPLEGASAALYASNAVLPGTASQSTVASPLAEVVTDGRGRFTMVGDPSAGRYVVVITQPGYTRVVRRLALEPST